ncbi:BamA/TamA family outer membrane protein [Algivirga pacifica]|uniref:Bacterial surface antigen (D15) domain-containing protein n=1 Tax=Algivirga pacifica TaxID=1162670 RepID=A0ABP9CWA4_9BACT
MKKHLLFFLLCLWIHPLLAQQDTTATKPEEDSDKLIREFSFVPLPVLAANPAVGFMFGVAPSASWMMGPNETTSRSFFVSTVLYTTKKQFMLLMKSNVFLKDDSWNLMGDWRFFAFSQPTYGLGTGDQSSKLVSTGFEYDDGSYSDGIEVAQLMEFNYFRFHETALKRIGDTRFFAGVGYHLDIHYKIEDQLLDLDTVPPAITSHYAYSIDNGFDPEQYVLSGVSFNVLLDSRDNPINPYDGRYAFLSFRVNPEFIGSDKSSTMLWAEYRDYFSLDKDRPRHLLALWAFGNTVVSGEVPYMDLPAIGWDQFGRSGRAYAQGRFRGQDMVYGELEYRFPLQKNKDTWGAVVFANATTATNRDANINLFENIDPAAGIGLRVMIDKKARTNITIDYGWGKYGAQGFYLNVNEAF